MQSIVLKINKVTFSYPVPVFKTCLLKDLQNHIAAASDPSIKLLSVFFIAFVYQSLSS